MHRDARVGSVHRAPYQVVRATCHSTPQNLDPTAIAANSVSETRWQQVTIGEILATLTGRAQQRSAMNPTLQPTVLAAATAASTAASDVDMPFEWARLPF